MPAEAWHGEPNVIVKASNARDATPTQHLEYFRLKSGIEHARRIRDELEWRWKLGVILWTLRHSVRPWFVSACTVATAIVASLKDFRDILS
jgi:hypothetical protein